MSYLSCPAQTYVFIVNHTDGGHHVLIDGVPGHRYVASPHPIVHATEEKKHLLGLTSSITKILTLNKDSNSIYSILAINHISLCMQ